MEKIRKLTEELKTAMEEYQHSKDYNVNTLEFAIDILLCSVPRDVVYVEWYDRSQIATFLPQDKQEKLDDCMSALWDNNDSVMDSYTIQEIVNIEINKEQNNEDD